MSDIKFGRKQFGNPTPAVIGRIKRMLNFFSGGVITFLPFLSAQLHTTTDTLATWMGIFMLSFNSLALFFGTPLTDETTPSEDVTEVETHKDK